MGTDIARDENVMTSRKNQQAAREYMRENPGVAYMEALRRTSGPSAASLENTPTRMLFDEHDLELPRVITVVGQPGGGKTTLLRGLMEQYRDSPTFALDSGDLLKPNWVTPAVYAPRPDRVVEGIEPWPMLTTLDVGMARLGRAVFPAPFDLDAIPKGSLLVLDMSFDLASDEDRRRHLMAQALRDSEEAISQWADFYETIPQLAHDKGITVVISVNDPNPFPESRQPGEVVKSLPPRLRGGIVIESRAGGSRMVYSVTHPGRDTEPEFFYFDSLSSAPEARESLPLLK